MTAIPIAIPIVIPYAVVLEPHWNPEGPHWWREIRLSPGDVLDTDHVAVATMTKHATRITGNTVARWIVFNDTVKDIMEPRSIVGLVTTKACGRHKGSSFVVDGDITSAHEQAVAAMLARAVKDYETGNPEAFSLDVRVERPTEGFVLPDALVFVPEAPVNFAKWRSPKPDPALTQAEWLEKQRQT